MSIIRQITPQDAADSADTGTTGTTGTTASLKATASGGKTHAGAFVIIGGFVLLGLLIWLIGDDGKLHWEFDPLTALEETYYCVAVLGLLTGAAVTVKTQTSLAGNLVVSVVACTGAFFALTDLAGIPLVGARTADTGKVALTGSDLVAILGAGLLGIVALDGYTKAKVKEGENIELKDDKVKLKDGQTDLRQAVSAAAVKDPDHRLAELAQDPKLPARHILRRALGDTTANGDPTPDDRS